MQEFQSVAPPLSNKGKKQSPCISYIYSNWISQQQQKSIQLIKKNTVTWKENEVLQVAKLCLTETFFDTDKGQIKLNHQWRPASSNN